MNTPMDTQDPTPTNQLSEGDTAAIMEDVSSLIFESALGRLVLELAPDQLTELEALLETYKDSETLLDELIEHFPKFEHYLNEAAAALEEKAEVLNS